MEIGIIFAFLMAVLAKLFYPKVTGFKDILNKILLYIATPILILSAFSNAGGLPIMNYVFSSFLVTLIVVFGMYLFTQFYRMKEKDKASVFLCNAFGNTGYFGIPFALLLFGPKGALIATIFSLVHTVVHFTIGIFLANTFLGKKEMLFRFFKMPLMWVILGSVFLAYFVNVPGFFHDIAMFVPYLAVFIVGLAFDFKAITPKSMLLPLPKLFLAPLLVIPFISFIPDGYVFLFQAATPAAILNTSLAMELRYNAKLASTMTIVGSAMFILLFQVYLLL